MTPSQPDASQESVLDAGFDGGREFDAGPARPVFASCEGVVVGVPVSGNPCDCVSSRQSCTILGCTWDCAVCSTLSPCPTGWECEVILPPYCEGRCRRRIPPCSGTISQRVELTLVAPDCRITGCRFRHVLDFDAGVMTCIAEDASDGGFRQTAHGGALSPDLSSGIAELRCRSTAELDGLYCVTSVAEAVAQFDDEAPITWILGSAAGPSQSFDAAALQVFRQCSEIFRGWDAGVYPFRF